MNEEKKRTINHLLYGGGTFLCSLLTLVVVVLFVHLQTSPASDVPRGVLVGGISIFFIMTLVGATGPGRRWVARAEVVGTVAALPGLVIVTGSGILVPLSVALSTFVPYYIARRWFAKTPGGNSR